MDIQYDIDVCVYVIYVILWVSDFSFANEQ